MLFATESGNWQWPAVRVGHVWNVSLAGAAGRGFSLRTLAVRPAVFEVVGFLGADEAAWVRRQSEPKLARSGVATTDGLGKNADDVRTSSNTFIRRGIDAVGIYEGGGVIKPHPILVHMKSHYRDRNRRSRMTPPPSPRSAPASRSACTS